MGVYTGAIPTLNSLRIPTSAELKEITDALTAITGPWAAYTPVLTNLTLGNGTLVAQYTQAGKLVHFRWKLTRGSTTSFTGAISVGLPVPALDSNWLGVAYLFQTGTSANRTPGVVVGGITTNEVRGAASGINATTPWTWTTGDTIQASGTYEAA